MQFSTPRAKLILNWIAIVLLVTGCSKVVYIESAGALLPVMTKGNKDSNQYLIIVSGGPAGDGIMYHYIFPFFKKLEKSYQIVYYDQRGSGNAKGSPLISTYNLEQHAIDLNRIVSNIKGINNKATIYLVGYSYGGSIAMQYLNNKDYEESIDGAIMIAGAFDRKLQTYYQQKLTDELLKEWVDEGYIASFDYLKSDFSCPPNVAECIQDSVETVKKVNKRFKKIDKLNTFPITPTTVIKLLNYALFAPGNPIRASRNEAKNGTYFQSEFDSLMVSDSLE